MENNYEEIGLFKLLYTKDKHEYIDLRVWSYNLEYYNTIFSYNFPQICLPMRENRSIFLGVFFMPNMLGTIMIKGPSSVSYILDEYTKMSLNYKNVLSDGYKNRLR